MVELLNATYVDRSEHQPDNLTALQREKNSGTEGRRYFIVQPVDIKVWRRLKSGRTVQGTSR